MIDPEETDGQSSSHAAPKQSAVGAVTSDQLHLEDADYSTGLRSAEAECCTWERFCPHSEGQV